MSSETIIENGVRCYQAYQRGLDRGRCDERAGYYNDTPLSGEWAGESIPELVGDLIGDDDDMHDAICDHYENGYRAAFDQRSFCDVCGDLCDPKYLIEDNDVTYCGPACSGDLG